MQAEAPVAAMYVPAGHNEQTVEAAADAYLPAAQEMQSIAPEEYVPAGQLMQAEAPVKSIYVPAVQSEQTLEPVAAAYLPAVQNEQVAGDAAPACPYFPTEQGLPEHVVEAVPAAYVPAMQRMQAEAPLDAVYLPAAHNEQIAADADVTPLCPYFPTEQSVPAHVDEEVADE